MELKEAVVKARIEPTLKHDAEQILSDLGITTPDAIRMFFTQIKLNRGIPFPVRIPSPETQAAIDELESGKGEPVASVEALFEDID